MPKKREKQIKNFFCSRESRKRVKRREEIQKFPLPNFQILKILERIEKQ
jgi:hypothetical protein